MDLSNESYVILISTRNSTERYYRDRTGWVTEQVLNHLLPALAGVKPGLTIRVEHRPR